jgi:hypothetical protein
MIIQFNNTKKEVKLKSGALYLTELSEVWNHYYNNSKFTGIIIHTDWITEDITGLVKLCLITGIAVALYDEHLKTHRKFEPIAWHPRSYKVKEPYTFTVVGKVVKGKKVKPDKIVSGMKTVDKLPSFKYHDSDGHAYIYKQLTQMGERNRESHYIEMDAWKDKGIADELRQLKFNKLKAIRKLQLYCSLYNKMKAELHDLIAEEKCRKKFKYTDRIIEEDVTFLGTGTIEEQVQALQTLYQFERASNYNEAMTDRIHGLYLLSVNIDPDLSEMKASIETLRTTPQTVRV